MTSIAQILEQRKSQHGDLLTQATISQGMKDVMRGTQRWNDLKPDQKECLEMVVHKIARILAGDPNFVDHWDDISGYSILISNRLNTLK
jgi:predicted nucleic acid-binding OB-fold protein